MDETLLQSNEEGKSNVNIDITCNTSLAGHWRRRIEAFLIRLGAALFEKRLPAPRHPTNCDEILYPRKIGSYSKGLPHNLLGDVNIDAYQILLKVLKTGHPEGFERIPLGGTAKLVDPQAAYAFDLIGPDSHHLTMPAPPSFSSAQEAGEMAEAYWQALTRDVPYAEYPVNPLTIAAAEDLSTFTDFRGPKVNDKVTPETLFRGDTSGDLAGPYISQFLWHDIPYGDQIIEQKYFSSPAGIDFLTSYEDWLNIQNGGIAEEQVTLDPYPRYINDNRILSEVVHRDFPFQEVLNAGLILLSYGEKALSPTNPYLFSRTQVGFVTFGAAHILVFTVKVARLALEAAWFQKWLVHRRLRPEEFGGRVHNLLTGKADYPIDPELLQSRAIEAVFEKYGTYLLPQAYPEGCPAHPAYPSGHATYTGAGVTVLKAFFNESFIIPDPVAASPSGRKMLHYFGPPLTVQDELNKLASNIAFGRNAAGVHWRTDAIQGMLLGERVAIGMLQDYRRTYNENFTGFTFTKFDGTTVTI